jgi:hypothetical protein
MMLYCAPGLHDPSAAASREIVQRPVREGALLCACPALVLPHCGQAFGVRGFYLSTALLIAISFGAELAYLTIIGELASFCFDYASIEALAAPPVSLRNQ